MMLMPIGVLAAVLQAAASPSAGARAIGPRTFDKGTQTMVEDPRHVTVRSADELAMLWRAHAPDRAQPPIDFSRDMLVGVFLGSRPTSGYDVEIVSVREGKGTLVVRYRATSPGRDIMTAQVLTAPYHLVVVPRYGGEVTFEEVK